MKKMKVAVLALLAFSAGPVLAQQRELIPTTYEAGHFFATPQTSQGTVLRLVVDTGGPGGGGRYVLSGEVVKRLGSPTAICVSDGDSYKVMSSISWADGKGLPVVAKPTCHAVAIVNDRFDSIANENGSLGAGYLSNFRWTFDYSAKQLWLEASDWKAPHDMHYVKLNASNGFPRINVTIDGEPLDFLLDTGATAHPTPAGLEASKIPVERGIGVTSYATTSVIDRWHRKHPDWRIVDDGDELGGYKARIIEVPGVQVAGWTIGPVWFTERADRAFSVDGGMSMYMDKPVIGSIGANVLGHFVMTLDYPADTAWFKCVDACQPR